MLKVESSGVWAPDPAKLSEWRVSLFLQPGFYEIEEFLKDDEDRFFVVTGRDAAGYRVSMGPERMINGYEFDLYTACYEAHVAAGVEPRVCSQRTMLKVEFETQFAPRPTLLARYRTVEGWVVGRPPFLVSGFFRLTGDYTLERGETVYEVVRCDVLVQCALSTTEEMLRTMGGGAYDGYVWINEYEKDLYTACYNAYVLAGGEPRQ